jgi:hypothetical protein
VLYTSGGWLSTNLVSNAMHHTAVNDAIVPSPGTAYTDAPVTNGVAYFYQIRSRDTLGHLSDVSLETSATPGTPPVLELTVASASSFDAGLTSPGVAVVSTTTFDIRNTGNVFVTLTFSVSNSGGGWAPVVTGTPGLNQCELDAQFNFPSPPASWAPANHGLRTAPPGPDQSSLSRFAGNETGLDVGPGQTRHLWVRLLPPSSTSQPGKQRLGVTLTAVLP